jgi:hypothetical protein
MRTVTRSGQKSSQMQVELDGLIQAFSGSKSYLEIGARHGDTFYTVMRSLPIGSLGVAVDYPGHVWGKGGTDKYLDDAANELRKMGYKITVLIGDSQDIDIIDAVKELAPFDACLIDGDHRYDGVKADWLNYGPLCKMVAFHDIVGIKERCLASGSPVEVPRLWQEIKNGSSKEFVADGSTMGIGVIIR